MIEADFFSAAAGIAVLVAVVSYFLGCVNGAILVSKYFYRDDVRKHGSGNAGLTNFYRTYGAKCALFVIALDVAKMAAAVALGAALFSAFFQSAVLGKYFAGLFCVIGHMFPVTEHFKGGKGILSSGTLIICIDWRVALAGWGAFLILVLLTRYVSLGSIAAAASVPFSTMYVYPGELRLLSLGTAISVLVIWAHRTNIKRLLNGTESKFHFHRSKTEDGK